MQYWVDWEPFWMCVSELGRAKEFVEQFEARLPKRYGKVTGKGRLILQTRYSQRDCEVDLESRYKTGGS